MIKSIGRVTSTNDYIKSAGGVLSAGDAVYSTEQTAGRGRRGRSWLGSGSLAFSMLCETERPELLPTVTAVAVRRVLAELCDGCKIKWPNDIVCDGKKLAGILCEGSSRGYISGVGINLSQTTEDFIKAQLPYGGSLFSLTGRAVDADGLALRLMNEMTICLDTPFSELLDEFRQECITLNRRIKILGGNGEYEAEAVEIANNGGLIIRRGDSLTTETVISGEVSVRGIYGY